MQATSYLVTAWEALAAQQEKKMSELPVLFEDVSIVQAVPVAPGGSVTLSVVLDASHRFQASLPWLILEFEFDVELGFQLQKQCMLPPGGYVAPTVVLDASHCFQAKPSCRFEFEFKSEFSLVFVGSAPGSSATLPTPVPIAVLDISFDTVILTCTSVILWPFRVAFSGEQVVR